MPASDRLDRVFAALLARRESKSQLRKLTLVPPGAADFSSNAYLSLSTHPDIQRRFLARIEAHLGSSSETPPPDGGRHDSVVSSTPLLGSGGSRLLDGNAPLAESLEGDVAAFHRGPAGLLFNSGFDANVGLFSCAPQPGDVIVYDELIHASVHDGMRLSRAAKKIAFAHNAVDPAEAQRWPRSLSEVLSALTDGDEGREVREGSRRVFVAVEGVYSMDGDVAPLKEVVECVERHLPRGNGLIIVDEAHSTGLLGERGRGLVCDLGLEDRVWARVHTFGKAMGCSGAIVLCSQITRSYLVNYARSLIYTTAMPFTSLAGIQTAYDFIANGHSEALLSHLWSLVAQTNDLLLTLLDRHRPERTLMHLAPGKPKSPIIPLFTSDPRGLAQHCQRRGFMIRPIVAPTVPVGSERVRICLHAGNTFDEVEGLVSAIEGWLVAQPIHQGELFDRALIARSAAPKSRL
ncbi:Aminotransferase class I and II [Colletotrichum higginsianum IMI 349063]|uniref:Aminotransferase class I and II n=2 Tax=Colletotrichum higginsianum TaxID=80884 RepID=A0A1B7Y9W4_COLHI|nr:Aminotransferase class I and II [Colletotrichum higginsianum IMI 349063]OBR08842.1 Aminotransferase class I and II [Colletotrichum higginsianum IMI 349063]TIC95303.1 putative 8-amino-7-oxononanoate synthase [Colletotrichum higginsianum]